MHLAWALVAGSAAAGGAAATADGAAAAADGYAQRGEGARCPINVNAYLINAADAVNKPAPPGTTNLPAAYPLRPEREGSGCCCARGLT